MKIKFTIAAVLCLILNLRLNAQTFTKILTGPEVNDGLASVGSAWIDINQDDDLDLFSTSTYFDDDRLYSNNGNGTFTQIITGSIVNDGKYSYNSTWGDYDNDGLEDAYNTNGNYNGNQVNSLFHNTGNGTFTQITTGIQVNDPGFGDGSSWADYDNDGNLDLFVTNIQNQANFLYHNNGNGTFTKITSGPVVTDVASSSGSPAWGDYDNDGKLDLFVSNFGRPNFLYHNDGSGGFTKITSGSIVTDAGDSHGASWGDYDNDGYLDLFVNRFFGQADLLYHNNGNGTFTKITSGPVVSNSGFGTGSAWGDYDNDGNLDLFVCNSSADAFGNEFNFLYHNNGNGTFTQVTTGPFPLDVSNARSASWGDYDNDGDLDLHVANENYSDDFLYQNDGNTNNWINIKCYGIVSNKSAIGTRINVKAVINGSPVWQTSFISAQSGYAGQNSLNLEFGLSNASVIDSMIVRWPSGLVCYFTNVASNHFVKIYENCTMTGIESVNNSASDLNVYPNPNSGTFTVSFNNKSNSHFIIELYNELSQKIYSLTEMNPGSFKKTFSTGELNLNNGIYFVKLVSGDLVQTRKIIISK
jgi:enediyne biosynthesis protein E4